MKESVPAAVVAAPAAVVVAPPTPPRIMVPAAVPVVTATATPAPVSARGAALALAPASALLGLQLLAAALLRCLRAVVTGARGGAYVSDGGVADPPCAGTPTRHTDATKQPHLLRGCQVGAAVEACERRRLARALVLLNLRLAALAAPKLIIPVGVGCGWVLVWVFVSVARVSSKRRACELQLSDHTHWRACWGVAVSHPVNNNTHSSSSAPAPALYCSRRRLDSANSSGSSSLKPPP